MTDYYKEEIDYLKLTIDQLKDENDAMHEYFDKLSIPIIKRAVRFIARTLRNFPPEARLFGDDSKLNSFEEFCVLLQEGLLDNYDVMEDTIISLCSDAYKNFNPDEKFIYNHKSFSLEYDTIEFIKDEFYRYATNYSNQKIEYALEHRNTFD
jgi:hypothetical protein